MKYKYLIISLLVLITACSSSKTARKNKAQMEVAPAWVKERPMSNMYYIGVAKVNKSSYPDRYQEVGKNIALNDLASEISVNIQSNSLVSSYEDNAGFQSEFTRFIQMEMTKDLVGYQMQGSYETDEQYMVYYRLSKAKWAEVQAERKRAAADRSNTLYQQGKKEEQNLNYPAAIKSYLNALLELKKYWNEAVYFSTNGENKRLDLELRSALTNILSSIQLKIEPRTIELNYKNQFKDKLLISVVNQKGDLLRDFPVSVKYRKLSIPYQTTVFSDVKAKELIIEGVKYKPGNLFVFIEIEKEKVLKIKGEDRKMLRFISDAFQVNPVKTTINYQLPTIFISSNKENSKNYRYLKDAVQQSLGKQYFTISNSPQNADLLFRINVHESSPISNSQVKSVLLSYAIEVHEKANQSIVYTYSSPKYKGVAYEIEPAREKAYIKAAEDINDSTFRSLVQAISN